MATCGLHFLIGNKGAGKTMMACKLAWKVLGETKRHLVTNLPVKWDGLADYMEQHYGIGLQELTERITIVDEKLELRRFWLHRGCGWGIPEVPAEGWKKGQSTDYRFCYRWKRTIEDCKNRPAVQDLWPQEIERQVAEGNLEQCQFGELAPVQYVIDEIQNIFPSREWQSTSPGLLWHLTQQRKLADDIIAISQRPTLMDKQFRELADDWLFLINWGKRQKGWFRLPKAMSWAQYAELPTPGVEPMVRGHATIDVHGVGATYDTSAGVGIAGALSADTGEKAPGFHWGLGVLGIATVCILLYFIPGYLLAFIGHWTHRTTTMALGRPGGGTSAPGVNPYTGLTNVHFGSFAPVSTQVGQAVKPDPDAKKRLTGITVYRGEATCWFSDGEVVSSKRGGFEGLLRGASGNYAGCRYHGREYWLGQHPEKPGVDG